MDRARRSLIGWSLRSHVVAMVAWGVGLAISIAATAAAYPAAAKAAGQSIKAFGKAAEAIAGSLAFLTGPIDRLDTIAGYVSYKIFPTAAVLLAVYGAIQGSQALRGAEVKGWFDLWFSAGRTRGQIARDRIVSFVLTLTVITICLYAGTVIGGVATGESLVVGGVGQCLAVALISLFAFSMSLFLSQFFGSTRTSSATTSAFMVATYFLANVYQSLEALSFLRYLSPFYYYLQMRTLVPGLNFEPVAALVLVVATTALMGLGVRLYLIRDANGVVFGSADRSRPANYTLRPTRIWRRTLSLNWVAEQPVALISWCLGIGIFSFVEAGLVPSALKLVKGISGPLKKLLEAQGGILSPDTYLSLLMTFTALLVAGFMVFQVSRWASDASQQRNDVIFSQPVSMLRFVLERMVSIVLLTAAVGVAAIAGTWGGALAGGYAVHPLGLLRVFGDMILFAFAISGVGLLLVTALRNGMATGVIGGLLVLSYFLDIFKALFHWPDWIMHASVFHAFSAPGSNAPYLTAPGWGDIAFLVSLGALGVVMAHQLLRRGIRVTA